MQEKFLAAVETERWRPVHAGFKSGFIVLKDLTPGALAPPLLYTPGTRHPLWPVAAWGASAGAPRCRPST